MAACWRTLAEMMFAGGCGVTVLLDDLVALFPPRPMGEGSGVRAEESLAALFAEELGAVLQVRARGSRNAVLGRFWPPSGLGECSHVIGAPNGAGSADPALTPAKPRLPPARAELRRLWSETSYRLQALRDHPDCAREAFGAACDPADPGLSVAAELRSRRGCGGAARRHSARGRRVAILREQGVNGQVEMAAAFDRAGFAAVDVHMSDIIAGRVALADFHGFAACGGFSYGDVLGAGEGWAKSILFNARALASNSPRSSRARIVLRWASAMAVRCCPICMS
jgi:phosphoribosylformylglycinamidine synthase